MSKLSDFLPKFAPLNGVGTSGIWPISINGNATSATTATSAINATNATNADNAQNAVNANNANTVTNGVYLTGAQTISDKTLTTPIVNGLIETAITMSANNIDVRQGAVFLKTISAATTLTVSGAPASGKVASFILRLTNGGAAVVTWWSGIKWDSGTAPTLTAAGKDNLGFYTADGGATWEGFILSTDSK